NAIIDGLNALGREAEKIALKVVIKLLSPFNVKVLGHSLVPGLNALIGSMKDKLEELNAVTKAGGDKVNATLGGIGARNAGGGNRSAAVPTTTATPRRTSSSVAAPAAARTGITAAQRNTFFDNALTRSLDRVQDIAGISGQIKALQGIAGQIQAR